MERLEDILAKYNFSERKNNLDASFNEVVNLLNFKLPLDYKIFAQNYTEFEGFIESQYICLWDFENILEMNKESGIFENLSNTLGIGGNGGGEFIAIQMLADHSTRIILSPLIFEETAHIQIGKSFTDFLEGLESGKEWFD